MIAAAPPVRRRLAEEEIAMAFDPKCSGVLVLRLLVGLALLGCARTGWPAGTWSVVSLPQKPGEVVNSGALAVDAAGSLYVADGSLIQKRGTQGNWSILATAGDAPGQVSSASDLAADAAGSLYVADVGTGYGRIQKRDAQGDWSVTATEGTDLGQVLIPPVFVPDGTYGLAVDTAGNLYVADFGNDRVQEYTPGPWSWRCLARQAIPASRLAPRRPRCTAVI
jgi:sugar lactone lactonase YvrE